MCPQARERERERKREKINWHELVSTSLQNRATIQHIEGCGPSCSPTSTTLGTASTASNQSNLQGLDALKACITYDHVSLRPQLQASRLQSFRCLKSKLLQGCLGGLSPWDFTLDQDDQGARIEECNHQTR